mmetsp:Transcript_31270/g.47716  ORF Transcript_31270/g.47716 Transcript_31270/m.47716 type:complete len:745 (+) Transcript_31270:247-2481(+)
MSSLLSFVWRRSSNNTKKATVTGERDSVPDVAPSSSGEEHLSPTPSMIGERQARCRTNSTSAPPTPEGLKPRRAVIKVREELGIPFLPEYNLPATTLPLSSIPQKQNKMKMVPVLPPLTTCTNPTIHSPQISNSSFYSRSSSSYDPVAGSPNLDAPSTAVGALVAATTYRKPAANLYFSSQIQQPCSAFDVLPPRPWMEDNTNNDDTFDNEDSKLIPSYERLHDEEEDDSSQENSEWNASFSEFQWQTQMYENNSKRMWTEPTYNHQQENDADSSLASDGSNFGSQAGLVNNQKQRTGYDFDSILKLNVSAISGQTDDQSSLSSWGDRRGHPQHLKNTSSKNEYYESLEDQEGIDALVNKKGKVDQRSQKEKRLLGCIKRLQSDVSLVAEIEQSSPSSWSEADDWFLKTPMDQEGLLLGLSSETTQGLSKRVNNIILEMSTAHKEVFQNPTEIEEYGDAHTDLELALRFLQQLLCLQKENNWTCKFQIRAEMGVEPLVGSPEHTVRGGDTSVFTLPEDIDTPHTSNVSIATTITTKVSPAVAVRNKPDAMNIRRTIEIFSTLLQRLTLACNRLLKTGNAHTREAILATEDIKRYYLQLLSIDDSDVRNVFEAFLEQPPLLVRTVSLDDEQEGGEAEIESIFQNEPILAIQQPEARHLLGVFNGQVMSTQKKCYTSTRIEEEEEYDEEEGEDLRRQIGSNDYDEDDGCREGPELDSEERDSARDFYQQYNHFSETKPGNISCGSI